ncbi:MAG: hypothetical protein OXE82_08000 [Rhodobacter sp.]|nr:hypothetical protein [Rhodobacter sp.]
MATQRSIITLFTGFLLAAGVGLVPPAQAGDVTVTEGGTATFKITVTQNPDAGFQYPDTRIRVYYASDGGTATPGFRREGGDYEDLNPGVNFVEGRTGQPMTISVQTHPDDQVEGDETIRIKVVRVDVPNVWWYSTALFYWTVTGLPTITIKDATPAPAPVPINWGLAACYWSGC